jgi:hypothetical protein
VADRRQVEKQKSGVVSASRRLAEYEGQTGGSGISPPKGIPIWAPKKEGEYRISVLPFKATDKIKKFVPKKTRFCDPGDLHYEQTYHNHRGIGPNNQTVICAAGTFNKPCPVCEFRARGFQNPDRDQDDEKVLKDLKPKERQLWLIYDHDDPKKGLQLFDVSFYLFGENLFGKIDRIKDPKRKAKADQFADPKNGSMLVVGAVEKSMGKGPPFLEFSDIQFEAREEPLPKELVKQAAETDLSACIRLPDYADLKKIFTTGIAGGGKKKDEEEPEDEDADTPEDEDEDEDSEGDGDEDAEEGDADDDEEGVEGDDDGEEGDDQEEEGGEEDEDNAEADEPEYGKGDLLTFKSSKGKKLTGKVVAVNTEADTPFYRIRVKDFERPFNVEFDQVIGPAKKPGKKAAEEEEEDEPPAKKPGKKKPKKDEFEDDDFERAFGGDDDEEEEKPKRKPGKKAGKPKKKVEEDDTDGDDPF